MSDLFFWSKLAMCAELGLCLFIAAELFSESKHHGMVGRLIVNALVLGLIVIYYFSIRHSEHFEVQNFTRYTLYILASHLLVAFAAFTGKGHINGFWQFNRALFLRFLLAFLYTVVLYGGIAIAMVLLDELLHVHIHTRYYAYAWFCMIGVFNTVFFLAGVPKNIPELDSDTTYLKGLKAFTQFVLLPLVTMYLLILYAYMVRILIAGSLPKGYVSYLVISFSGMGILSLLLIYPIRKLEDNKWIQIFSKWFYRALYPLIILFGFSISHRVSQYGITADRYFMVVLALWLACIAAYFLFSKKENIKLIPISLGFIALFSAFGPWGAFNVAANSQTHQLEKLLEANKAFSNGKLKNDALKDVQDSVSRRAESIIRYLVDIDEESKLQPWVKQNLDSLHDSNSYRRYSYDSYREAEAIMSYMGFAGYEAYTKIGANDYDKYPRITFNMEYVSGSNSSVNISVKGYDYYSQYTKYSSSTEAVIHPDTAYDNTSFMAGNNSFMMVPLKQPGKYGVVLNNKTVAVLSLEDSMRAWKKRYTSSDNDYVQVPGAYLTIPVQGDGYDFVFRINTVTALSTGDDLYVWELTTDVLTKVK